MNKSAAQETHDTWIAFNHLKDLLEKDVNSLEIEDLNEDGFSVVLAGVRFTDKTLEGAINAAHDFFHKQA